LSRSNFKKKSFRSGTLCYYFKNAFLNPIPRDSAKLLLNAASDYNYKAYIAMHLM